MSKVLDVGCIGDNGVLTCSRYLDLGCAVDPEILAYTIAYEVVHQFGLETRYFLPHNWACLYVMFV